MTRFATTTAFDVPGWVPYAGGCAAGAFSGRRRPSPETIATAPIPSCLRVIVIFLAPAGARTIKAHAFASVIARAHRAEIASAISVVGVHRAALHVSSACA